MAKRKRGRKAERGEVGHPTSYKIPLNVMAELRVAAAETRRSVHWTVLEILDQWIAYRLKAKKK